MPTYPGPWNHIRIYVDQTVFILQQLVQNPEFTPSIRINLKHEHREDKLEIFNTYDRRYVDRVIEKVYKDLKLTDLRELQYMKNTITTVAAPKSGLVAWISDKQCSPRTDGIDKQLKKLLDDTVITNQTFDQIKAQTRSGVRYSYKPYPLEQHENEPPIPVQSVRELFDIIKAKCPFVVCEDVARNG